MQTFCKCRPFHLSNLLYWSFHHSCYGSHTASPINVPGSMHSQSTFQARYIPNQCCRFTSFPPVFQAHHIPNQQSRLSWATGNGVPFLASCTLSSRRPTNSLIFIFRDVSFYGGQSKGFLLFLQGSWSLLYFLWPHVHSPRGMSVVIRVTPSS